MTRYKTKQVLIGGRNGVNRVPIGGDAPVVIQTMWKEPLTPECLAEGGETQRRIDTLSALGCGLLRFAVPTMESAETLGHLAAMCAVPLVADIHFDYKIALRVLDFPISKLRINPGNIGGKKQALQVLAKAQDKGVPVRIGVNGGSLPRDLRGEILTGRLAPEDALVRAAERQLAVFDEAGFENTVVSLKISSASRSVAAARAFASRNDRPLHIGVTEAGPLIAGVVRNTAAIYILLSEGIGDTVRVSLSDTMENEVIAAREMLLAVRDSGNAGRERFEAASGVRIVSCPRCGRRAFDTHAFIDRWQTRLYAFRSNITVAVMGCPVNGPDEARDADIGITGAGGKIIIFKSGKVCRRIDVPEDPATAAAVADQAFLHELERL
ncbi:MAG: (E)-4-hydroxy-3-methylbut-2-enyl-diphosphate synthase [Spirochaetaceae bacterium]|jgi:(E)-4-hydroxy-3-methylbut-2-enyl-diphosphate synthase|nr:(E)-4-hydroxy-3-methylbut-2-enyl-diphosphate synthase [Spirochaetaceae bacterium]